MACIAMASNPSRNSGGVSPSLRLQTGQGAPAPSQAQARARVAGKQRYEVSYESKKTGRSATAVKKAVKKGGIRRSC
jgi:uncharacterized protein DUF3606